jgi:acetamidase/formamidase
VATTFPHFGALTTTEETAMLHPPLDELTWIYAVDVERGVLWYRARRSDHEVELPLNPVHGPVGVAPADGEVLRSKRTAETWTPRRYGPAPRSTCR